MTDPAILQSVMRRSTHNEAEISRSRFAGCFYCLGIFPASEVKGFLAKERTALCPRCTIDSVIGDQSGLPITREFLAELHAYWFKRGSHSTDAS